MFLNESRNLSRQASYGEYGILQRFQIRDENLQLSLVTFRSMRNATYYTRDAIFIE